MGRALGIIWVCEWIVVCDHTEAAAFFVIKSLAVNSVNACAPLAETVLKKPMSFPMNSVNGVSVGAGWGADVFVGWVHWCGFVAAFVASAQGLGKSTNSAPLTLDRRFVKPQTLL
jgi:hypothetical protein